MFLRLDHGARVSFNPAMICSRFSKCFIVLPPRILVASILSKNNNFRFFCSFHETLDISEGLSSKNDYRENSKFSKCFCVKFDILIRNFRIVNRKRKKPLLLLCTMLGPSAGKVEVFEDFFSRC